MEASRFRQRMRARERPAQPPLPGTVPCPLCGVTVEADCEYDREVRRFGLTPAGPRPRGCLVRVQTDEIPF